MKPRLLIFSVIVLFAGVTNAAPSKEVDCNIFTRALISHTEDAGAVPISFDISGIEREGDGPYKDFIMLDKVVVSLDIYLTNKDTGELTLQFNEKRSEKSKVVLASTFLQTTGITKLLYRTAGSNNYIMAICNRK